MVHGDKQLDEVEKVDTMVIQEKIVLILNIDFHISEEYHDVMDAKLCYSTCSQMWFLYCGKHCVLEF